jgi:hypothetical protein
MLEAQDLRQYSSSTVGLGLIPCLLLRTFFDIESVGSAVSTVNSDSEVSVKPVCYYSGGPMELNSRILLLAHMVYL